MTTDQTRVDWLTSYLQRHANDAKQPARDPIQPSLYDALEATPTPAPGGVRYACRTGYHERCPGRWCTCPCHDRADQERLEGAQAEEVMLLDTA